MGEEELLQRLISMEGEIKLKNLLNHSIVNNSDELSKYDSTLIHLMILNISIDATATPTISTIKK